MALRVARRLLADVGPILLTMMMPRCGESVRWSSPTTPTAPVDAYEPRRLEPWAVASVRKRIHFASLGWAPGGAVIAVPLSVRLSSADARSGSVPLSRG